MRYYTLQTSEDKLIHNSYNICTQLLEDIYLEKGVGQRIVVFKDLFATLYFKDIDYDKDIEDGLSMKEHIELTQKSLITETLYTGLSCIAQKEDKSEEDIENFQAISLSGYLFVKRFTDKELGIIKSKKLTNLSKSIKFFKKLKISKKPTDMN